MFNAALKPRRIAVAFLKRYAAKRQSREAHAVSLFLRSDVDHRVPQNENLSIETRSRYSTKLEQSFDIRHISSAVEQNDDPKLHMLFHNKEDSFAHSVMKQRKAYANTIVQDLPFYKDEVTNEEVNDYLTKKWVLIPIPEIIEAFKRISYFASKNGECIADAKYTRLIKYLVANTKQFTDSEIIDVMKGLALWPLLHGRKDTNFKIIIDALDRECIRRAPQWDVNELLLITDHWYVIKMVRYSSFCSWVISRLGSKPNKLNRINLVQYMFYTNAARTKSSGRYNLEYRLESCIYDLDIQELAIISLGLFKTQTPIRSYNLLVKMIRRTMDEIETIDSISLAALLKIIGYSYMVLLDDTMVPKLLVSTLSQVPRISLQTLIHIVTVTIKLRLFQPELLTAISKRYSDEIRDARVKDLERLVLALSMFNFTPDFQPNIFETVINELRRPERQDELTMHAKCLGRILRHLGVMEIYPKDLIATVLDPAYIEKFYGKSPYKINDEILCIDLNVEIEVPDYTGPRLNNKTRSVLAKEYINKLPDKTSTLSRRQVFLLQVLDSCELIFDSNEMAHVDWLLPQYKDADIVICLDKNDRPVSVKDIFSDVAIGDVKRRPENYPEGCKWLALIIAAQNCFRKDDRTFLGNDSAKLRQLKKIGYTPVVVSWYDWFDYGQNKYDYLKKKILQS